jgi:hypothetical protein
MPVRLTRDALLISPSISAVFFALLPKCPVCVALLLAPLGVSFPRQSILPVIMGWLLLAIPVAALSIRAKDSAGSEQGRSNPRVVWRKSSVHAV